MAETVGELRKLLEGIPEDTPIGILDDYLGYRCGIDVVHEALSVGLFEDTDRDMRYYLHKPAFPPVTWIKDVEVLILG